MRDIDLDQMLATWQHLQVHYRTRVVAKATSPLMRIVAVLLALVRILPARSFLQDFTTTIGHRIYLPHDLDAARGNAHLCFGYLVLCVHEHQHVVQWDRGPVRFVLSYLLSPMARARHEAEAYATALDLAAWAGRPLPSPQALAERLQHYGCGPRAIAEAARLLAAADARARQGGTTAEASRVAIAFLERELLAAQ